MTTRKPKNPKIKVALYGPNGMGQGPAIHVHAAECEDLGRRKIYRDNRNEASTAEITGWLDIVSHVYPPGDFQYDIKDADSRSPFESDIKVFPCVTLPENDAAPVRTSGRGISSVSKDGQMTCRVCHTEMSVTKFPTKPADKDGVIVRDDRCRPCQRKQREANKAAKATAGATTTAAPVPAAATTTGDAQAAPGTRRRAARTRAAKPAA